MTTQSEKRIHERVTVNEEFSTVDQFVEEYVTNVSKGGVFVRSRDPQPVGTEVDLKFTILTDDFYLIEGKGKVVRVDTTPGRTGMGIVFTELTPESAALLDNLIEGRKHSEDAT
ncbi:MAG: PilZ domain-containing protein [Bradymonadales bacterium]|nr:PilZ domain-containing protein [Bradymonadales bacterium]